MLPARWVKSMCDTSNTVYMAPGGSGFCLICNRRLNVEGEPLSADTGGDCWGCIGKIEADAGCEMSVEFVRREIAEGWRLADGAPKPSQVE